MSPNSRATGALARLARSMKWMALSDPNKRLCHQLSGGAKLTIYVTRTLDAGSGAQREWHLLISRRNVPPSPTEVADFRAAFEVPHGCVSERIDRCHVRCVWQEVVQEPIPLNGS